MPERDDPQTSWLERARLKAREALGNFVNKALHPQGLTPEQHAQYEQLRKQRVVEEQFHRTLSGQSPLAMRRPGDEMSPDDFVKSPIDFAFGAFRGGLQIGQGLAFLGLDTANQITQLGAGLLVSPLGMLGLPEPEPLKRVRETAQGAVDLFRYLPISDELRAVASERPDDVMEFAGNLFRSTGVPDTFDKHYNLRMAGAKGDHARSPDGQYVPPEVWAYALLDTIAEFAPITGDYMDFAQAYALPPGQRAVAVGEAVGRTFVSNMPFALLASRMIRPLAKSLSGVNEFKDLARMSGEVTLSDLSRMKALAKQNANLHTQVMISPENLAAVINVPQEVANQTREYIKKLYEENPSLVQRMNEIMVDDRTLSQSDALLKALEEYKRPLEIVRDAFSANATPQALRAFNDAVNAGRVPMIEIGDLSARHQVDLSTAAQMWIDDAEFLIGEIRKDRTRAAKDLDTWNNKVMRAALAAHINRAGPVDQVKLREATLRKKYANMSNLDMWMQYPNILARSGLSMGLSAPQTLVRDVIGQHMYSVVDLFEKALADAALDTMNKLTDVFPGTKSYFKNNVYPVLSNPRVQANLAADTFHGYVQAVRDPQLIIDIVSELPVLSQQRMANVRPDAFLTAYASATSQGNRLQRGVATAQNFMATEKAAIQRGKTLMQEGLRDRDHRRFLTGFDLAAQSLGQRVVTAHRIMADVAESRLFFAGGLQAEASKLGFRDLNEFYDALKQPKHDPQLDVAWKRAADFRDRMMYQRGPDHEGIGKAILDAYQNHPIITWLAPDYPRFLYNRFMFMLERNPGNLLSMFDPEFRGAMFRGDVDMSKFKEAAKKAGISPGTPEFDAALQRARADNQRAASEHIARGVSGLFQLLIATSLRESIYAGNKFYELDFGTNNDPKPGLEDLLELGVLTRNKDDAARYVLDMRAYDPQLVPQMGAAEFVRKLVGASRTGSGNLKEDIALAAKETFDAADVADFMFGMRGMETSIFNVNTLLSRALSPTTENMFGDDLFAKWTSDEILTQLTTPLKIVNTPIELFMDEAPQLDPFMAPLTGRPLQNVRGIVRAVTGKDLPLPVRQAPGANEMLEVNKAWELATGSRIHAMPQLYTYMRGANMTMTDFVGQPGSKLERQERFRLMNEFLTLRTATGETIGDALSYAGAGLEIEAGMNKRMNERELLAFRRWLLTETFQSLRDAGVIDAARIETFRNNRTAMYDYLKSIQNPLIREFIRQQQRASQ